MSAATPPTEEPHSLPPGTTHQMAQVLRFGLGLAVAILFVGVLRALIDGSGLSFGAFDAAANHMAFDLNSTGSYLLSGNGAGIAAFGLLVLVATPVARVAYGVYGFWKAKDPTLARIAAVVFLLLLVGLFALGPLLR